MLALTRNNFGSSELNFNSQLLYLLCSESKTAGQCCECVEALDKEGWTLQTTIIISFMVQKMVSLLLLQIDSSCGSVGTVCLLRL